jgi:ribosomal protein S18 acetylase RimI-like enzyme
LIEIKRLGECTPEEATQVWNQGFSDYAFNMETGVDGFVRHLVNNSLSVQHSLLARVNGKPAGILLSGIKKINGTVHAWNGGTAVVPEFRGNGLGKRLMETALDIYREANVQIASLEVLTHNEKALSLYEQYGYRRLQKLSSFECAGVFSPGNLSKKQFSQYDFQIGQTGDVSQIPFYDTTAPWQAQWNLIHAQSLLIRDPVGTVVCFALFKQSPKTENKQIRLYQCVLHPDVDQAEEILELALRTVFGPAELKAKRVAPDFVTRDPRVTGALLRLGFTVTADRYLMMKHF